MPTPITPEIRERIEADFDRWAALEKQRAEGLDAMKAGAVMAAQGDVEAADALRKLLANRGVGDEGFVRIVKAAGEIVSALRKQLAQPDAYDRLAEVFKRAAAVPQEPATPEIPEGAGDDAPPPGPPASGRQPSGDRSERQPRRPSGKFQRFPWRHQGAVHPNVR